MSKAKSKQETTTRKEVALKPSVVKLLQKEADKQERSLKSYMELILNNQAAKLAIKKEATI